MALNQLPQKQEKEGPKEEEAAAIFPLSQWSCVDIPMTRCSRALNQSATKKTQNKLSFIAHTHKKRPETSMNHVKKSIQFVDLSLTLMDWISFTCLKKIKMN